MKNQFTLAGLGVVLNTSGFQNTFRHSKYRVYFPEWHFVGVQQTFCGGSKQVRPSIFSFLWGLNAWTSFSPFSLQRETEYNTHDTQYFLLNTAYSRFDF